MTLNMKPFNLEAAMRGEPIVTRDGRKAKFVAYEPEAEKHKVVALVDQKLMSFNEDGSVWLYGGNRPSDLFMVSPPLRSINGYEFPEPVREPLNRGQEYYLVDLTNSTGFFKNIWDDCFVDVLWLKRGLIQLSIEGAEAQYKAMVKALEAGYAPI
jgi:hypothetical protein